MSAHVTISRAERAEQLRADKGYITASGLVICGACRDDARYSDAQARWAGRSEHSDAIPFNPGEGDDWCSDCDRNITSVHSAAVIAGAA